VSTVEHHCHPDARAHGQIVVEGSKGERSLKIQVVAVEWFDAPLQRVESQHAAATEVEEAVVINTVIRYISKVIADGIQHLAQTSEGSMFIPKNPNLLRRKVLVMQRTLHERQIVGNAGQLVIQDSSLGFVVVPN